MTKILNHKCSFDSITLTHVLYADETSGFITLIATCYKCGKICRCSFVYEHIPSCLLNLPLFPGGIKIAQNSVSMRIHGG
jgi:hypothetical protein